MRNSIESWAELFPLAFFLCSRYAYLQERFHGFSAFLKLLQLPDGPRRAELKKKLGGGGGFQYWRPVQLAAPKAILPGANLKQLRIEIGSQATNKNTTKTHLMLSLNGYRENL